MIMCDQLSGPWYNQLSGDATHSLVTADKVKKSLATVYNNNVLKFCDGKMGACNGMIVGGEVDRSTVQSEEMWTGVTYALASHMLLSGMTEEGLKTAEGVYRTVYETIGMGFQTPEALYEKKHYRSVGYMRPLSIWAMYLAWKQRK